MFNPHDIMQLLLKIFMWVSNHIRTYRVSQKKRVKSEKKSKISDILVENENTKKLLYYMQDLAIHPFLAHSVEFNILHVITLLTIHFFS